MTEEPALAQMPTLHRSPGPAGRPEMTREQALAQIRRGETPAERKARLAAGWVRVAAIPERNPLAAPQPLK